MVIGLMDFLLYKVALPVLMPRVLGAQGFRFLKKCLYPVYSFVTF